MESNRLANLVSWLRISAAGSLDPHVGQAAEAIELLQRELKCANELWEQQKELALEYLADIEKANERIAELEVALKPFAKAANDHSENTPNYREAEAYFTLGQLRAARKVLEIKND